MVNEEQEPDIVKYIKDVCSVFFNPSEHPVFRGQPVDRFQSPILMKNKVMKTIILHQQCV